MLTRILVDTNVVRNHVHESHTRLDLNALHQRAWKYRVSLSDTAASELTVQLLEQRIPFHEWRAAVSDIDRLIDPSWPIFPGGSQLADLAGTQLCSSLNVEEEQRHRKATWFLLSQCKSLEEMHSGVAYRDCDGSVKGLCADVARARQVVDDHRNKWIDYFDRMRQLLPVAGIVDRQAIQNLMQSELGRRPEDPPDMSYRLDACVQMLATFVSQSLQTSSPYNPGSDNRRGDVFDFDLLFALPLPAIVCTADGPLLRRLRATESSQAHQLVSIEELNQRAKDDSLEELLPGHHASQLREWRENAYSLWVERGCPEGDDWVDWFAATPIA